MCVCVFPSDLQVVLHLFQRLDLVLGVASLQQTVTAHVQPLVGTVVAQNLRVGRAASLGKVTQRVHQQVGAVRRPLQVGLQVLGAQGHLASQTRLDSLGRLRVLSGRSAAIAWHTAALLLALGAGEAALPVAVFVPSFADAGRTEAVATRQRVDLGEGVSAHGAGELLVQGGHVGQGVGLESAI